MIFLTFFYFLRVIAWLLFMFICCFREEIYEDVCKKVSETSREADKIRKKKWDQRYNQSMYFALDLDFVLEEKRFNGTLGKLFALPELG